MSTGAWPSRPRVRLAAAALLYAGLVGAGYRAFLGAVAMSGQGSRFDAQLVHTLLAVACNVHAVGVAVRYAHPPAARDIEAGHLPGPSSHGHDDDDYSSSSGHGWAWRLLRAALVLLPLVLPFGVSYRLYADRSDPARAGTRLSADINLILFTLVTAACFAALGLGWALRTRLKLSCGVCVPLGLVTAVYVYLTARAAYSDWSRGLNGRYIVNAESYYASRGSGGGGRITALHVLPPDSGLASLEDTADAAAAAQVTCVVPPHMHVAALVPRRLTNFFAGSETCPAGPARFSRLSADGLLTVACDDPAGATVDLNPDWISGRRQRRADMLRTRDATPPHRQFRYPRGGAPVRVDSAEYLVVTCRGATNFHVQHVPRRQRIAAFLEAHPQPSPPSSSTSAKSDAAAPEAVRPNVIVTLIDALSREHFLRRLPRTVDALEKLQRDSGNERQRMRERLADAYARNGGAPPPEVAAAAPGAAARAYTGYTVFEFFRYHILGYNTRPNFVPLFCGTYSHQAHAAQRTGLCDDTHTGDLLYRVFHDAGYVTALLDNHCQDPVTDYLGGGDAPPATTPTAASAPDDAGAQPTDNGDGTSRAPGLPVERVGTGVTGLDAHAVAPFCHPQYDAHGEWSNFAGPYSVTARCIDGRYVHAYALEYMAQFSGAYRAAGDVPHFGFAAYSEAHEGSLAVVTLLDADLAEFVTRQTHLPDSAYPSPAAAPEPATGSPEADDTDADADGAEAEPAKGRSGDGQRRPRRRPTIHILMSDHGNHMGPAYEWTAAGRIEHRLPALFMLVPNALLDAYPALHAALLHNQQALCTAADLHQTLRHLTSYPHEPAAGWAPNLLPLYGRTLLRPIPYNRTCADAGIPGDQCVCGMSTHV